MRHLGTKIEPTMIIFRIEGLELQLERR